MVMALAVMLWPLAVGCKNVGKSDATNDQDSTGAASVAQDASSPHAGTKVVFPEGSLKIVWVNMDTLLDRYDYYFDQKREMTNMTSQAEKELQMKGQALERRMATFQDNVQKGLMTRSEAQKEQEALQIEQGRFLQLQEQHRQKLMDEEQVRTRKVMAAITDFIQKYNEKHGYDYVLSGPMLYGSPMLNVTDDVLQGLNAEYSAQRKAQTTAVK